MRTRITEQHDTDGEGNPSGGATIGTGILIAWQSGPMVGPDGERLEQNGAFVEDVIAAALGRLEHYNSGKFRCRDNSIAITHLEDALLRLGHRNQDREDRGVEGTHET